MTWRDFIGSYCNYLLLTLVTLGLLYGDTRLDKKLRREFFTMVGMSLLIVLLDFLSEGIQAGGQNFLWCTVITHVNYALKPALLYLVLLVSERSRSFRRRQLEAIPLLLLIVLLAVSFPFRWIAWHDPVTGSFRDGPLIPVTWISLLVYLLLILQSAFSGGCSGRERMSLLMGEVFIVLNILNERVIHIPLTGMEYTVIALTILVYYLCFLSHYEREFRLQQERELSRSRTQAMISQIQPHFIYNTLSCIAEICHEGSPQGEEAVLTFSGYLRSCFHSLTDDGLIPFSEELATIRQYIALEQMQDPNKIRAEYDIRETAFRVPVLALQTLVENAVRHGLRKKRGGGTVTIRTVREERGIIISICDDGVGFDTSLQLPEENHLGLKNAKMRLGQQCGADLKVTSQPGQGTQIEIILKEEMQQ